MESRLYRNSAPTISHNHISSQLTSWKMASKTGE